MEPNVKSSRKVFWKILIFFSVSVVLYTVLKSLINNNHPLGEPFALAILGAREVLAALGGAVARLFDATAMSAGTRIYLGHDRRMVVENGFLSMDLTAFLLVTVFFTPVSRLRRVAFAAAAIPATFLFNALRLALTVALAAGARIPVPVSVSVMELATVAFYLALFHGWIRYNSQPVIDVLTRSRVDTADVKQTYRQFVVSVAVILVVYRSGTSIFAFEPWVQMILRASSAILTGLGHEHGIAGNVLYGRYVTVYMNSPCLGILLILVFCAFIYMTGEGLKRRLAFMAAGVAMINLINVFRVCYIFIHVTVHRGKYLLGVDIHDLFNFVVYAAVFLMWVVWIEFFSDHVLIRKFRRRTEGAS